MKKIVGILTVLFLASCSPDAKLLAENEELKAMMEKLTTKAEQAASEARNAQANAEAAAAEAAKQMELAEEALRKLKDCQ